MPSYDVLTHCELCGEFKFCRLAECADEICAFCPDCDQESQGDPAAAIESQFEDTYSEMKAERRRAVSIPRDSDDDLSDYGRPFLFSMGRVLATRGALTTLATAAVEPSVLLARHAIGDWGDISEADWKENELSLNHGFLLISSYRLSGGTKVWVVTEADRSTTTLLLPSEY